MILTEATPIIRHTGASAGTTTLLLAIGIVCASRGEAQAPATSNLPIFDVASIRISEVWKAGGEGRFRSRIRFTGSSLTMGNVDLLECVQWAYGVQPHQVSGKGLPDSRYDILAKTNESVSVGELRRMLQSLLSSRFKLTLHREKKSLPVYELSVAKGGARLPPRSETNSPVVQTRSLMPAVRDGGFVFANVSMEEFAEGLADLRGIDRPVVDRTGIEGRFDITLRSAAEAMLREDGPSLFTLIQEQLGLKLVAARGPVEVLVIDHAAEPSEN
jgi:uncharacterized protein (TIGR03435 family)